MSTNDTNALSPEILRVLGILSLDKVKESVKNYEDLAQRKTSAQDSLQWHEKRKVYLKKPLPTNAAEKTRQELSEKNDKMPFVLYMVINILSIIAVIAVMIVSSSFILILGLIPWVIKGFFDLISLSDVIDEGEKGHIMYIVMTIFHVLGTWFMVSLDFLNTASIVSFWVAFAIPAVSFWISILWTYKGYSKREQRKLDLAERADKEAAAKNEAHLAELEKERIDEIEKQKEIIQEAEAQCAKVAEKIRAICPTMVMEELYTEKAVDEMISYFVRGKADIIPEAMLLYCEAKKRRTDYDKQMAGYYEMAYMNLSNVRSMESRKLKEAEVASLTADRKQNLFEKEAERLRKKYVAGDYDSMDVERDIKRVQEKYNF